MLSVSLAFSLSLAITFVPLAFCVSLILHPFFFLLSSSLLASCSTLQIDNAGNIDYMRTYSFHSMTMAAVWFFLIPAGVFAVNIFPHVSAAANFHRLGSTTAVTLTLPAAGQAMFATQGTPTILRLRMHRYLGLSVTFFLVVQAALGLVNNFFLRADRRPPAIWQFVRRLHRILGYTELAAALVNCLLGVRIMLGWPYLWLITTIVVLVLSTWATITWWTYRVRYQASAAGDGAGGSISPRFSSAARSKMGLSERELQALRATVARSTFAMTMADLRAGLQAGRKLCLWRGLVIDIGSNDFAGRHPGGTFLLSRNIGEDITAWVSGLDAGGDGAFKPHAHSAFAIRLLLSMVIGAVKASSHDLLWGPLSAPAMRSKQNQHHGHNHSSTAGSASGSWLPMSQRNGAIRRTSSGRLAGEDEATTLMEGSNFTLWTLLDNTLIAKTRSGDVFRLTFTHPYLSPHARGVHAEDWGLSSLGRYAMVRVPLAALERHLRRLQRRSQRKESQRALIEAAAMRHAGTSKKLFASRAKLGSSAYGSSADSGSVASSAAPGGRGLSGFFRSRKALIAPAPNSPPNAVGHTSGPLSPRTPGGKGLPASPGPAASAGTPAAPAIKRRSLVSSPTGGAATAAAPAGGGVGGSSGLPAGAAGGPAAPAGLSGIPGSIATGISPPMPRGGVRLAQMPSDPHSPTGATTIIAVAGENSKTAAPPGSIAGGSGSASSRGGSSGRRHSQQPTVFLFPEEAGADADGADPRPVGVASPSGAPALSLAFASVSGPAPPTPYGAIGLASPTAAPTPTPGTGEAGRLLAGFQASPATAGAASATIAGYPTAAAGAGGANAAAILAAGRRGSADSNGYGAFSASGADQRRSSLETLLPGPSAVVGVGVGRHSAADAGANSGRGDHASVAIPPQVGQLLPGQVQVGHDFALSASAALSPMADKAANPLAPHSSFFYGPGGGGGGGGGAGHAANAPLSPGATGRSVRDVAASTVVDLGQSSSRDLPNKSVSRGRSTRSRRLSGTGSSSAASSGGGGGGGLLAGVFVGLLGAKSPGGGLRSHTKVRGVVAVNADGSVSAARSSKSPRRLTPGLSSQSKRHRDGDGDRSLRRKSSRSSHSSEGRSAGESPSHAQGQGPRLSRSRRDPSGALGGNLVGEGSAYVSAHRDGGAGGAALGSAYGSLAMGSAYASIPGAGGLGGDSVYGDGDGDGDQSPSAMPSAPLSPHGAGSAARRGSGAGAGGALGGGTSRGTSAGSGTERSGGSDRDGTSGNDSGAEGVPGTPTAMGRMPPSSRSLRHGAGGVSSSVLLAAADDMSLMTTEETRTDSGSGSSSSDDDDDDDVGDGLAVDRPYTIVRRSGTGQLVLYVKRYANGTVSRYICDLKPGAQLAIKAPLGMGMRLDNDLAGDGVIVAVTQGTGINAVLDLLVMCWERYRRWWDWRRRRLRRKAIAEEAEAATIAAAIAAGIASPALMQGRRRDGRSRRRSAALAAAAPRRRTEVPPPLPIFPGFKGEQPPPHEQRRGERLAARGHSTGSAAAGSSAAGSASASGHNSSHGTGTGTGAGTGSVGGGGRNGSAAAQSPYHHHAHHHGHGYGHGRGASAPPGVRHGYGYGQDRHDDGPVVNPGLPAPLALPSMADADAAAHGSGNGSAAVGGWVTGGSSSGAGAMPQPPLITANGPAGRGAAPVFFAAAETAGANNIASSPIGVKEATTDGVGMGSASGHPSVIGLRDSDSDAATVGDSTLSLQRLGSSGSGLVANEAHNAAAAGAAGAGTVGSSSSAVTHLPPIAQALAKPQAQLVPLRSFHVGSGRQGDTSSSRGALGGTASPPAAAAAAAAASSVAGASSGAGAGAGISEPSGTLRRGVSLPPLSMAAARREAAAVTTAAGSPRQQQQPGVMMMQVIGAPSGLPPRPAGQPRASAASSSAAAAADALAAVLEGSLAPGAAAAAAGSDAGSVGDASTVPTVATESDANADAPSESLARNATSSNPATLAVHNGNGSGNASGNGSGNHTAAGPGSVVAVPAAELTRVVVAAATGSSSSSSSGSSAESRSGVGSGSSQPQLRIGVPADAAPRSAASAGPNTGASSEISVTVTATNTNTKPSGASRQSYGPSSSAERSERTGRSDVSMSRSPLPEEGDATPTSGHDSSVASGSGSGTGTGTGTGTGSAVGVAAGRYGGSRRDEHKRVTVSGSGAAGAGTGTGTGGTATGTGTDTGRDSDSSSSSDEFADSDEDGAGGYSGGGRHGSSGGRYPTTTSSGRGPGPRLRVVVLAVFDNEIGIIERESRRARVSLRALCGVLSRDAADTVWAADQPYAIDCDAAAAALHVPAFRCSVLVSRSPLQLISSSTICPVVALHLDSPSMLHASSMCVFCLPAGDALIWLHANCPDIRIVFNLSRKPAAGASALAGNAGEPDGGPVQVSQSQRLVRAVHSFFLLRLRRLD